MHYRGARAVTTGLSALQVNCPSKRGKECLVVITGATGYGLVWRTVLLSVAFLRSTDCSEWSAAASAGH